jgi:hypothetical protein
MNKLQIIYSRILLIAVVCFAGCRSTPPRMGVTREISRTELVDSWIGLTEWDTGYYKLILDKDGTGFLYGLYASGNITTYKISDWSVGYRHLKCTIASDRSPSRPVRLEGEFHDSHIPATITTIGGTTTSVLFRRENRFQENLSKLHQVQVER